MPFQHVLPQNSVLGVENSPQASLQPLGKGFETYPSPTLTLERLLKHIDALLRLGHSDIDLKEVLVEGDISLCMDLGMKGLIVSKAAANDPAKALIKINRARKLSIRGRVCLSIFRFVASKKCKRFHSSYIGKTGSTISQTDAQTSVGQRSWGLDVLLRTRSE